MADMPPSADSREESTTRALDRGSTTYPGTPRWVKVSGIIALILAVLVVIVMVASGGGHGPARHVPLNGPAGHIPPVAQEVHRA